MLPLAEICLLVGFVCGVVYSRKSSVLPDTLRVLEDCCVNETVVITVNKSGVEHHLCVSRHDHGVDDDDDDDDDDNGIGGVGVPPSYDRVPQPSVN